MTTPLDLSPFYLRARKFLLEGRVEDAFALYGDVLAVDPLNQGALVDRGTAYAMTHQPKKALADLERALELGHRSASAFCTIGTIFNALTQYERATGYFAQSIATDPTYALAFYNRATAWEALGKNAEAISDLQHCLTKNPDEESRELIERRLASLRSR